MISFTDMGKIPSAKRKHHGAGRRCADFDLHPVFRTIGSWKIPVMMAGPEREEDDEVQRGADRLYSAAG